MPLPPVSISPQFTFSLHLTWSGHEDCGKVISDFSLRLFKNCRNEYFSWVNGSNISLGIFASAFNQEDFSTCMPCLRHAH